jgi:RNA polymerase sigma factor (sigma-70 family)
MQMIPASEALERLIQDYGKLVFHTIYGLTGNWQESQDLTQETYLHALKAIDGARAARGEDFHARAWLLQIALNTVRMQRRRRARVHFLPFACLRDDREESGEREAWQDKAAPVQPAGYGAGEIADPAQLISERDLVQRVLAKLPETLRAPLLLSIVGGFSHAELAELLNLKEVAVRQRLARARKAFKRLYAYESGEVLEMSTGIAERKKRARASLHRSRVPARRVPWSAGPARVSA